MSARGTTVPLRSFLTRFVSVERVFEPSKPIDMTVKLIPMVNK